METDNKNEPKQSKWNTDRIMGIAAIFISILSMISVIYQSYLAREENELIRMHQSATVLPYLSTWHNNNDGKFEVVIGNKGVGPAFIKEAKFMAIDLESKDSFFFNNSDYWIGFMEKKSEILDAADGTTSTFTANMLLPQGETKNLVVFYDDTGNEGRLLKTAFKKFKPSFNIVYEDVYGATWMLDSDRDGPIKLDNDD